MEGQYVHISPLHILPEWCTRAEINGPGDRTVLWNLRYTVKKDKSRKLKHVLPVFGPSGGAFHRYPNMLMEAGQIVFEGNIPNPCLGGSYGIR